MLYSQSWQSFASPQIFPQVISLLTLIQKLLYNQKYKNMYIVL